ncbi:MAG: IspD/TarI family cytidylyltransferase [Spirochaetaceae bacterium]|jgi:2-C-methyl-D-erythritol 4-phosphate cytidylyltransferase|nr:IspD/TarI family cytidylyltransferase [Spirochaetaceae bacterium]
MTGAVILAAGSSQRMGSQGKKELLQLQGRPVIYHSVKAFIDSELFDTLLITCPEGGIEQIRQALSDFSGLYYTQGGKTRQQSVYQSLQFLKEYLNPQDVIFIHDGARPWINKKLIKKIYQTQQKNEAVIPVEPSTQAMKIIDAQGKIITHLKRQETWAAQTPQAFRFDKILWAHDLAIHSDIDFIDDSEVWSTFIGDVWTVEGNPENKKITYQGDL